MLQHSHVISGDICQSIAGRQALLLHVPPEIKRIDARIWALVKSKSKLFHQCFNLFVIVAIEAPFELGYLLGQDFDAGSEYHITVCINGNGAPLSNRHYLHRLLALGMAFEQINKPLKHWYTPRLRFF